MKDDFLHIFCLNFCCRTKYLNHRCTLIIAQCKAGKKKQKVNFNFFIQVMEKKKGNLHVEKVKRPYWEVTPSNLRIL